MAAESASSYSSTGETIGSGSTASQALDLAAVLKMSQALSSEIELEPLLTKLLHIVPQSAGADQCVLLLLQDGALMVSAMRQRDQSIALASVPLEASQAVPIALINAVKGSLETSIIAHVAQHPTLIADPYILRQQPQSVLCAPLLHQGKLLGMLYLENNVTVGAFTDDRVERLNLLCSQAAIALENAQRYAHEQAKTQALQTSLNQLQQSEWRFKELFEKSADAILLLGSDGFISCNQAAVDLFGCEHKDQLCYLHPSQISPEFQPDHQPSFAKAEAMIAQALEKGCHQFEWMHQRINGESFWAEVMLTVILDDGKHLLHSLVRDISDRKRGEAERKQAIAQLRQQAAANQLLASVAQTINQSVQLDQVLAGCLEQVRQFFQSDRVLVCSFDAAYNVVIELEALSQPELSLLGHTIHDSCFAEGWAEYYRQGYVTACNDAQAIGLIPCYAVLLAQLQVQASLAVGILQGDEIWGLMIVHYCYKPYEWQQSDIDLVKQLGLQFGIANQKAILYTQLEAELAERRRTETALRLSEERYRFLTNVTTQLLWTTDADGQVVEDLPSWRAYTGQSFEAIKGAGAFQALHPKDYEHLLQAWTHAVQTQSPYRLECRVRSTDGNYRYFDVQGVPVLAEDGSIREWMGACVDIDDRKQAEAALQKSLQERKYQARLLQTVLDSTCAWIFAKDQNFRYVMVNRSYAEAIGHTVEAILGSDDLELGFPQALVLGDPEKGIRGFRADDRRALAGEVVHNPYDPATIADGSQRIFDTLKSPLYSTTGDIFAMLGFCNDVTELKQAETQLRSQKQALEETLQALQRTQSQMVQSEKMSGLGQLVAGVAHEINNPVNFIYGNLIHANSYTNDLLGLLALYQKHYPTPHTEIQTEVEAIDLAFLLEDLPKLLTSMRVGAERIQKIVSSLRNFSRMDEAEVKAVNLHDGIDSTLMILQHRLKATPDHPGIKIIKEYGNLPLVECYAGQLNQVFMNVLSNAIDALDEKIQSCASRSTNDVLEERLGQERDFQPTLIIRTTASQQQVRMSFADNGSGIPDAIKLKLFDPFFTTKPVGKGTGMGLAISHQIVTKKHGGSLQFLSTPEQGTEFIIEIPIHT